MIPSLKHPTGHPKKLHVSATTIQADGFLWMAHSFSTLSSLKDELEIGESDEKKGPQTVASGKNVGDEQNYGTQLKLGIMTNEKHACWIPILNHQDFNGSNVYPRFSLSWLRCTNPREVINQTE